MFSIFKKKTIIPHVRLAGVIGSAGKFKQGLDLVGQKNILKKAFCLKKIKHVAISINSPGGSPVQSHLIYSYIRQLADKKNISRDTIARMASFKRHQKSKDVPYSEGCGGIMWDAWCGTSGVEWASNKLKQIDK